MLFVLLVCSLCYFRTCEEDSKPNRQQKSRDLKVDNTPSVQFDHFRKRKGLCRVANNFKHASSPAERQQIAPTTRKGKLKTRRLESGAQAEDNDTWSDSLFAFLAWPPHDRPLPLWPREDRDLTPALLNFPPLWCECRDNRHRRARPKFKDN